MGVQRKEPEILVMGYRSQDQVDNAENVSSPGSIMANLAGVMAVDACYFDIVNSLEKMIKDFNPLFGFLAPW